MKFNSIEYNANFDESDLTAPALSSLKSNSYNGCELTITGKTFKSGTYGGVFVPCEIKLSNGEKRKISLALSNDTLWGSWEVTGGI